MRLSLIFPAVYSPPEHRSRLVHDLIPLSALAVGQLAQVGLLLGQPEQVQRLHEIGLRDGTSVEMVQQGSPCIIRLGGQKLCFRADDLLQVLVRPGTGT